MSASDLLTEVESAIVAILTGAQSYELRGRKVTKADLGKLKEFRRELQDEASQSGSMASVIQITRPT